MEKLLDSASIKILETFLVVVLKMVFIVGIVTWYFIMNALVKKAMRDNQKELENKNKNRKTIN